MKLSAAKCPCCGGRIQVPDEREKIYCMWCGESIIIEHAVSMLKVEHAGSVKIEGVASDDSLLDLALIYMANDDDDSWKAYECLTNALKINPRNYKVWEALFDHDIQLRGRTYKHRKPYEVFEYSGIMVYRYAGRPNEFVFSPVVIIFMDTLGTTRKPTYHFCNDSLNDRSENYIDNAIKFAPQTDAERLMHKKRTFIDLPKSASIAYTNEKSTKKKS